MGLGTGVYCKYCGKQIYMDDNNAKEMEQTCGSCMAIKKIVEEKVDRISPMEG